MKTAAAYVRVSTDDQIEYSPDSQIKKIREYAESHDMILPDEFIFLDEGISGRSAEKRPQFMNMIGLAKSKPKPFDVILLWKFSRFARNRQDAILYKSMLRKDCSIDVVSITEQLSDDPTSILIEALLEAMDEYYSINLAQEVKRGMTEKFSRGGVVTIPSFGYDVVNGEYVINETEAPIVKMIFEDFVSGVPYKRIAMKLNALGIKTKRGNSFENRTVQYILLNPVYIGKLRWTPTGKNLNDRYHENPETLVVDSNHQHIISQELFDAAQRKIREVRGSHTPYERHTNANFMLKGLVRCSSCGSTLVLSSRCTGLQCHKYARGQCLTSHYISLNKINKVVLDKIETDLSGGIINVEIAEPKHSVNKAAISALLAAEKRKLKRVKDAYEAGVDTLEEYTENKLAIMKRIKALESESAPSDTKEDTAVKSVRQKMSNILPKLKQNAISEAAKNELLKSFVSDIVFDRTNSTIQIHYYVIGDK